MELVAFSESKNEISFPEGKDGGRPWEALGGPGRP